MVRFLINKTFEEYVIDVEKSAIEPFTTSNSSDTGADPSLGGFKFSVVWDTSNPAIGTAQTLRRKTE